MKGKGQFTHTQCKYMYCSNVVSLLKHTTIYTCGYAFSTKISLYKIILHSLLYKITILRYIYMYMYTYIVHVHTQCTHINMRVKL